MLDSLYHRKGTAFAAFAAAATPVRITPNRRQIDKRFPVLGFTVDSGGLPFFEVLLTTDRSLFDPANAARRTAANFYASRQDSGLIAAEVPSSVYMVPAPVLHAFGGSPAIYYTAVAYANREGGGPVFAQAPEILAAQAPAVSVAADFRAQAMVLGVPVGRLARLREDGSLSAPFAASLAAAPPLQTISPRPLSAEEDRAEGEDGYGLTGGSAPATVAGSAGSEDGYGGYGAFADGEEPYDRYGGSAFATGEPGWGGGAPARLGGAPAAGFDYDDGFDGPIEAPEGDRDRAAAAGADAAEPSYSRPLESAFPPGSQPPAMLEDDDGTEPGRGAYDDEAASFSLGEEDEEEPPFEALDAPAPASAPPQPLTVQDKVRIIRQIAPFESGSDLYAAINADGEFEGRFRNHPARGRYHIGLSYGIIQFTQDSGVLGRLLRMMQQRDAAEFGRVFGPQADELIRVTTAQGPSSRQSQGGRSARVQPVGGADLWRDPWLGRFRQAAAHVPFQAAQNELAASAFLDPMIPMARWLGLDTDRALAMVFDRAVQMGVGGARRWIMDAVGPVQTAAQRQQALAALGHADLQAFQRATQGLRDDGQWGPVTHAAMVAALRRLGSSSPLPIPGRDQMMDAMVRQASSTAWARRTSQLRSSNALTDAVYAL